MWDFGPALFCQRAHILNRIKAASDRRRLCFNKGDFSGATVSVTPQSFNLVIRMACCVIVTSPNGQKELATKE